MSKLAPLVGLVMALAIAFPEGTEAAALHEVEKLTVSDAQEFHWFGHAVAVSDDVAVVGAPLDDGGADNAGAAYIFERGDGGGGNWAEVAKIVASDAQADDGFGISAAVSGDTAIVGADGEDAGGGTAGAAYVLQRGAGGDSWGEVKKLTASDAEALDRFGTSVAISGDTAVVGAFWEDAGGTLAGAAYVFHRDQGGADSWGEVKKLTASDAEAGDQFGWSVAVAGDTAVIGAYHEDAGGSGAGAAYVFQRDQGGTENWGEVIKLAASDAQPNDQFGRSVAVSGPTAVVGAHHEDSGGADAGAAYIFRRDQGGVDAWGEVAKLTASDAEADDAFGWAAAVGGDTVVVGAPFENTGLFSGAAYVFRRDQGGANTWGEVAKLTASDAQPNDDLGWSAAISGNTAFVGAYQEDPAGTDAGAAYVFDLLGVKSTPTNTPLPTATATTTPPVTATPTTAQTLGDANCDQLVNAVDAAFVLQYNAGLLASLGCPDGADVNGDGDITSVDATLVLQFVAGLLGSL